MSTKSRSTRTIAMAPLLTVGGLLVLSGTSYSQSPLRLTYVSYGGTGQDAQIKRVQEPYTAKKLNITSTNTSPPTRRR